MKLIATHKFNALVARSPSKVLNRLTLVTFPLQASQATFGKSTRHKHYPQQKLHLEMLRPIFTICGPTDLLL